MHRFLRSALPIVCFLYATLCYAGGATIATANVGANQVTLNLTSPTTSTGSFTLLTGSNTACGTAAQVAGGKDSSGAVAPRLGSVALTANTPAVYTVRNLLGGTAYTACFTPDGSSTPVTTNVTTSAARDLTSASWANVGSSVFNSILIGGYPYVAFAPDGTPNVGFMDFGSNTTAKLSLAAYTAEAWSFIGSERFSTDVGNESAFAIAPDGTPYMVYNDASINPLGATVMKYSGGAWSVVGTRGFAASSQGYALAFGPDGTPYVSNINDNDGGAYVYKLNGTSWTLVGSGNLSGGTIYGLTMTVGPDGTPYVAYGDGNNSARATVASFSGSWNTVGSGAVSVTGGGVPVIAISPAGTVFLAFTDGVNSNVNVKQYNGSAWNALGSLTAKANQVALTFAPDGNPVVGYTDLNANSKISVIKYTGSAWALLGSADFSTDQAGSMTLAESPDGTPYVAYLDASNYVDVMSMQAPQPVATTGAATSVKPTTATLNGTVNDNGVATTISFDYGTSTSYGTNVAATTPSGGSLAAGTGATSASVNLTSLTANTAYHFRVNATANGTTINGSDATFTTPSIDHLSFTVAPSTATAGTSFNVTVTAYADSGTTVATSYTGPVAFTSIDSQAVLPTTGLSLTSGVGTFAITLKTTGTQTLTVKDSNSSLNATSGNIVVSAATAATISAATGSGQSASIGAAFTSPLVVQVLDAYSNPIGGNVVAFTAPSTGASASLSSSSTCTTSLMATPAGSCSVTATANGIVGSSYSVTAKATGVTTPATFALTNNQAATTVATTPTATAIVYGQPVTLNTAISPSSVPGGVIPGGTVTYYDGANTLSPSSSVTVSATSSYVISVPSVAVHTYSAQYSGDNNFAASTKTAATSTVTVSKASSTLTGPLTVPVQITVNTSASIPVTVSGQYSGSGISVPSGSIGYTIGSPCAASCTGTATLASGAATISTPATLASGSYTITITYAGDTNYSAATNLNVGIQVGQLTPIVTYPAQTAITYGTTLVNNLNATTAYGSTPLTSGGTTAYTAALQPSGTAVTVTTSTILTPGTYTLTATWTPNSSNQATYKTASNTTTLIVNKATPSDTLQLSAATILLQNMETLTATIASTAGAPTGTVQFLDGVTPLGSAVTLVNGVATLPIATLGVGTHSITATYSGDANFNTITSTAQTVTVQDFNLTITASGGTSGSTTASVLPGQTAVFSFTIAPSGSATTFPAAVNLSVSGLPAGATYTLSPTLIASGAGATNVTLTVNVPTTAEMHDPFAHYAPIALGLLLLPFAGKLRRAKLARMAALLLLLAGGAATLTGCGNGTGVFTHPATNNVITITGTSGALTHSTTVTLIIN